MHEFRELDPRVDVFGQTAVATYRFEIRYDMGDQSYDEHGQDVLVFARQDGRWQVVWRAILPVPSPEKAA